MKTRLRARAGIAARAVMLIVFGGCTESMPVAHTIAIRNFAYVPTAATVAVGDTLVFRNEDYIPHSATEDGNGFDSGALAQGQTWRYVAARKGRITYHCTAHPSMKAALEVR